MKLLVTGATGKVGRHFLDRFLNDPRFARATARALCHNRILEQRDRLEICHGSISGCETVKKAMEGVTHVLHLATCKETPNDVMDVTAKGLFWLLEECRTSPSFQQFILIGGDASVGHFVYPYDKPITENVPHRPYPGCYALSKVLEEVMLEQYYIQYDLNGCCLRAPWIMEKDDFKYHLSFGEDVFGAPRWCELVSCDKAEEYKTKGTVPLMQDAGGRPIKRNFVHVSDLVEAILKAIDHANIRQELVNVCMDEPVDYGEAARHLKDTRGLDSVEIPTEFHSTWLDNTKARLLLGWRPEYDLPRLIDSAYDFRRGAEDPRKIWYPG